MKNSKFFNLNWADLGKGLLIAFLTALLGGVLELLQAGELPTTWVAFQPILELSLAAAVSYLLKNLFTNSEGQLARGEKSAAEYRAKRAGKLVILLPLFILLTAGVNAQSPWAGFTKKITPQLVTDNAKAPLTGTYLFRFDVGLTCPSVGFKTDEAGKITGLEGKDFSKLFAGILYTHVKPDGSRDWGVGGGLTVPYGEGHYGAAALVGYSVFRVGVNVDFGVPVKQGLSLLGGITVDLFNLTE